MMPQEHSPQPPSMAAWLLDLFAPEDQDAPMLGDFLEEFSTVAARSGVASARSWYWRQTWKTIAQLMSCQFRMAPLSTLTTAVAALMLWWLAEQGMLAILPRFWGHYPSGAPEVLRIAWLLLQWNGNVRWVIAVVMPNIALSKALGWTAASIANGREMAMTMTLSLAMGLISAFHFLHLGWPLLWPLALLLAAIPGPVLAGGILRRKTTRRTPQLSAS